MTEKEKQEIIEELRSSKEFLIFLALLMFLPKLEEPKGCMCAAEESRTILKDEPLEEYDELQRDDHIAAGQDPR